MPITLLYGGLLALGFLVLSMRVIRARGAGITLGDGGDIRMLRLIRAHGNFAEYVPLILVLMAMLETQGLSPVLVHVMGLSLLAGRAVHAVALTDGTWMAGRVTGMVLTFTALMIAAAAALWQGLSALA